MGPFPPPLDPLLNPVKFPHTRLFTHCASMETGLIKSVLFLPPATKLRRLCFYRCLSVHGGGGIPACLAGGIPACLAAGLGGAIPACLATGLWGGVWSGGLLPGGAWSGGGLLLGEGGTGIPACTETDPRERRLLLRTVRVPLECILFSSVSFSLGLNDVA